MSKTCLTINCLLLLLLCIAAFGSTAMAQAPNFQGEWEWAIYPTTRSELPPAYRNEPLKSVPVAALFLKIRQRGRKLTVDVEASARYLARLEDSSEVDAALRGNSAHLELTSGFGGEVTVLLSLQGNRLRWKTIKSTGENYFPDDVFLHRVVKRKRRH